MKSFSARSRSPAPASKGAGERTGEVTGETGLKGHRDGKHSGVGAQGQAGGGWQGPQQIGYRAPAFLAGCRGHRFVGRRRRGGTGGLGIVNALRCDRLATEGRQDLAAAGASGARTGGVGG